MNRTIIRTHLFIVLAIVFLLPARFTFAKSDKNDKQDAKEETVIESPKRDVRNDKSDNPIKQTKQDVTATIPENIDSGLTFPGLQIDLTAPASSDSAQSQNPQQSTEPATKPVQPTTHAAEPKKVALANKPTSSSSSQQKTTEPAAQQIAMNITLPKPVQEVVQQVKDSSSNIWNELSTPYDYSANGSISRTTTRNLLLIALACAAFGLYFLINSKDTVAETEQAAHPFKRTQLYP